MPRLGTQIVTIAQGTTVSSAINLRAATSALVVPAGTLTGGTVSYQASADGGSTWTAVRDAAGAVLATAVPAGSVVAWPLPEALLGASAVRLVSNAAEGAARTFSVLVAGR